MSLIKNITSTTGHSFSFLKHSNGQFFFKHQQTGFVYLTYGADRRLRDEIMEVVNCLGEISLNDFQEIVGSESLTEIVSTTDHCFYVMGVSLVTIKLKHATTWLDYTVIHTDSYDICRNGDAAGLGKMHHHDVYDICSRFKNHI